MLGGMKRAWLFCPGAFSPFAVFYTFCSVFDFLLYFWESGRFGRITSQA
jgi:hypothetical protein